MRAGALRERIEIWSYTAAKGAGAPKKTYAKWISVRAEWHQISGKETILSETPTATTVDQFTVRYREGIEESMRVKFRDRFYGIQVLETLGNKTAIKITAQKLLHT